MTNKTYDEMEIPIPGTSSAESIHVKRFGRGSNVVVLSNADSHNAHEWDSFIEAADTDAYTVLTYSYPVDSLDHARALDILLDYIESEERVSARERAEKIVLVGIGGGGVASLQAASRRGIDYIAGIAVIAAPIERDGERLYTDGDLRQIIAPKLFICSEFDDLVDDARSLFAIVEDPRRLTTYPGEARGGEMFSEHGESLTQELLEFITWAFCR